MAEGNASYPNTVVSYTKEQAFPSGAVISLENYDDGSGNQSGARMMSNLGDSENGKSLQESYRANLPMSKAGHEPVANR